MAKGSKNNPGNGIQIKLTYDQKKRQYRKMIGRHQFWLGPDESTATRLALSIQELWDECQSQGNSWSPDDLMHIDVLKHVAYDPDPTPGSEVLNILLEQGLVRDDLPSRTVVLRETEIPETTGHLTEAIEAYQNLVRESPSRSAAWKKELCRRVEKVLDVLADQPLKEFGHDTITKLTETWIGDCKAGNCSPETLKDYFRAARQFVDWLDRTDQFNWQAPRRMEQYFRVPAGLPNIHEDSTRTFSTEELKKLYQTAWSDRLRLFLLLGLQCGFYQSDIASLTPGMLHLKGTAPRIKRPRKKSNQPGQWILWPETAELLRNEITAHAGCKPDESILRNQQGELLVRVKSDGGKLDSISTLWQRLLRRCGYNGRKGFSFKHLRKTGAQMIRNLSGNNGSGEELAEAFLAHQTRGVGKHYHGFQDWPRLDDAILSMRDQLQPIFDE